MRGLDTGITDQMMYGQHAVRVPAWMYSQDCGEETILVGATTDLRARFGSGMTHQFMLGEIIMRPHFVVASNAFRGYGVQGLVTANHMDFLFAPDSEVICDPIGRLKELHIKYQALTRNLS